MQYELVPTRLGTLAMTRDERAILKHAKALHRRALEVRVEDAARLYVARGRTHDIRDLTKDTLEAAGEIGDRLAYEAQARPFFARELEEIASTGARGVKTELTYFIEEGH
jgi:DNA transposition AAA+ family ATPase